MPVFGNAILLVALPNYFSSVFQTGRRRLRQEEACVTINLSPAPLVAKICCYGGQAIRLRIVKSIAFMARWLENCSREAN